MVLVWFQLVAITDSRPCVVCRPSMAASYFLLLAQKKVTKRKRHPRIRAARGASGSLRADGFGPQAIPALLSESARSLAPPALRAAFPSALRRCSEGTRRQSERKKETDVSDISDVAYIRCFCGRDCRALLFPGSLSAAARRRRKSREAVAGRMPATFDESTRMCSRRSPPSLLAEFAGHGCPANRDREGAFFFGYFLLGKQKKVTGDHGWPTKHTRT